ncbi:hypothetical protein Tco_0955132 [Tanacetum coccineum]|uniref:Uncharacterized protein n=1 Tax=Tanacetum coccineum TaxID=301880 RepID=A0ABQ5E6D3_9ASTR
METPSHKTDPSYPLQHQKLRCWLTPRRNNEKALNILLSAIPDRHLLSFHDAEDARTLWSAIKARFGDANTYPKGSTPAASSKVQNASQLASHTYEIICPHCSTHLCLQLMMIKTRQYKIDEDAMEEIDIRWQVAMITARIRKFAKYQENRANGRQEKRIVAIEDPSSKALMATDNNEDIDWTKEFDADPVTFALMALTEIKVDDWSMEARARQKRSQDRLLMKWMLWNKTGYKDSLTCLVQRQTRMKADYGTENGSCQFKNIISWLKANLVVKRFYLKTFKLDHSCLVHVGKENQKRKGPDWMFDLELLSPSMNYIHVRKENYADSGGNVLTHDDVEDLDDQQFIVHSPNIHAAQNTPSEERTADKEVPLFSEEQALHDELKRRDNALMQRKKNVQTYFTLSTAKTPPQSTGNTSTDSDDDVPKDGVFSTNSFDDEHTDNEEDGAPDYNNMDHTIMFTPTLHTEFIRFILKVKLLAKVLLGFKQEESLKKRFVTTLAAEEAHSTSPHSRAASSPRDAHGPPDQSAAQASLSQGIAEVQGTADFQGMAETQGSSETSRSKPVLKPNNFASSKATLMKLSKGEPVVKHHAFWVESQNLKKQKRRRKKQRQKVSSVKLGRNNDEGNLSEEHHDQDDEVLMLLWDTEELDLEEIQSTARQSAVTPRTLNFEDEAGPSSPIHQTQEEEPKEQFKDDEILADIILNRPRGLSIPGPIQSQPQQPTQATDPKDKGKGILVEEPKKKKLTLQQIRALETTNDEEVARKIQAEWDAEEERKRLEELKKAKPKTILKKIYFSCSRKESNGLVLLGDLTTIWETPETSDDDFWKNQEDWEIIRWRLNESSGVHTLELEDGTMIHMLAERRYPLSRELMIRMLDHGMEVEDENEIAITLIHLFILWTTKDGDDS